MGERPRPGVVSLIGMGLTLAACLAGGLVGGYVLDGVFHTGEVLTFVGLGVGIVASVTVAYFEIRKSL
jgi:hypothetical protein